ncbi:hypothetical protein [Dactylosporangium sp. NPDC005555]|uniref:hypothetical protein n=1 Tax=Dactylosporangium sp. NPDC005555 TaxID=3154889 RepID=UPI00339FDBED
MRTSSDRAAVVLVRLAAQPAGLDRGGDQLARPGSRHVQGGGDGHHRRAVGETFDDVEDAGSTSPTGAGPRRTARSPPPECGPERRSPRSAARSAGGVPEEDYLTTVRTLARMAGDLTAA